MDDLYSQFKKYQRTKRIVIVLLVLILFGGSILGMGLSKGWFDNFFSRVSPRYI